MTFLNVIWAFFGVSCLVILGVIIDHGFSNSLTFVRNNADLIKIVLVVIAAAYTAAVFHLEVRDRRIASTLEYSRKMEVGHINDAFQKMNEFWIKGKGLETLMAYRENKISNDEWANRASDFIRTHKQENDIMTQHKFYKDVIICVDQNRCHEETACQLFANDVENFRLTYRHFLDDWQKAWGGNVKLILRSFHYDCVQEGYI